MSLANGKKKRISDFVLLGMLFFVCAIGGSSPIQAQDDSAYIELVRILDPDFIMPHATGLAYSPTADVFLVLDGEESNNLTMISPFDDWMGSDTLPSIANPINMAFDSKWNRLLLFDTASQELIVFEAVPDGYVDPTAIGRVEANQYGAQDPKGMATNPMSGTLFILSAGNSQIVRIQPDAQGSFDGPAALAEGRISWIDLTGLDLGDLQGLAFYPADGHLHVMNPSQQKLYELSENGQLVATRDMSPFDSEFRDPQGVVFAPSADLTDDPTQMHLFLVDSGLAPLPIVPSGKNLLYLPCGTMSLQVDLTTVLSRSMAPDAGQDETGPGRIFEFSLTQPALFLPQQQ